MKKNPGVFVGIVPILSVIGVIGLVGITGYFIVKTLKTQNEAFVREEIVFELRADGNVEVKAKYWIKNKKNEDHELNFSYPFPKDPYLKPPEYVAARTVYGDSIVEIKPGFAADHWLLNTTLRAGQTPVIEVCYQQKTIESTFKYMLTSTKSWGRALKEANFIIRLPKEYVLTYCSYVYAQREEDDFNSYEIYQTDFIPKQELVFSWAKDK